MKTPEFIEILKERNIYSNKKTSVFARLMTYFLSFVLLFFLLFFLIDKYTLNFWFSLIISFIFTLFISMRIVLFVKRKYLYEIKENKERFLLKRRTDNLYLLIEDEIKGLAFEVISKKCNGCAIEKRGAFLFCENKPVVFFNTGERSVLQCNKIKLFLNMGNDKIIAVCTEEQKKIIEKSYSSNIYKIIVDTEIAENFAFLDYGCDIREKFDIMSVFNAKTASVFIRLSVVFVTVGMLSGKMKYFGGICFVFCVIGVAIKTICRVRARK